MKKIQFEYQPSALIDAKEIEQHSADLAEEIKRIKALLGQGYESNYASLMLPFDTAAYEKIVEIAEKKKALQPSTIVVIGIGGSHLGSRAVFEMMYGPLYNEKGKKPSLYFADTIDPELLSDLLIIVERDLVAGGCVLLNVISKTGMTTETIANFELFLQLIKKYRPTDFAQYIVATTGKDSLFSSYARQNNFDLFEIEPKIEGRYAVFSAVALFPLVMVGIDGKQLLEGAAQACNWCLSPDIEANPAAMSALLKYAHYLQGVNVHDTFIFSVYGMSLGAWYRQLVAESIGKEFNCNNQRVEVGITPTVSVGTADLHSVGQLYLGGPYDKFTTFLALAKRKVDLTVPDIPDMEQFVANIQGKSLTTVYDSILSGVQAAYTKRRRPFCTLRLADASAYAIGQLMQLWMLEIIYLGYLFNINPFDQPNVDSYKKETRKILAEL